MRVRVDPDRCMGHGMCAALVPSVFTVNDETGMNEMGEADVPAELGAQARRGVVACPEQAITLLEESTSRT